MLSGLYFQKNLLKEVKLTKQFVKQIIVALKFVHTRFAVFFPCQSHFLCRKFTIVTHSDSVGLGTLRT